MKKQNKKIALFGGSFNPPHNDHVRAVNQLENSKIIDEVWVLPCYSHSFNKNLASFKYRVDMLNLAFSEFIKRGDVKISKLEKSMGGKSYTYRTINKLKEKYGHKFYWVIGTDILPEIEEWDESKKLKSEVEFIVLGRPGYKKTNTPKLKVAKFIPEKNMEGISSTQIRDRIYRKDNIKNLVPKKVNDYIKDKGIYK